MRTIEQRTWRALKEKASPGVMQALAAYAVAVGKIGRGTGKSANRHRKTARNAADAVKSALPCWIMPHSRVSESLPAELGIFDLVIVDEASQSTLSRSEEHTSELQSLMRISYAVFCLKKKNTTQNSNQNTHSQIIKNI